VRNERKIGQTCPLRVSGSTVMSDSARATHIITDWQSLTPESGAAIAAFWQREQAIGDAAAAQKRLPEVVAHAVTESGEIAAICTAVAMTLPRIGEPMYYYRCFVGKAWRGSRLAFTLLRHTQRVLEAYAIAHGFPCIGIVMEMENTRFGEALRRPVWPGLGFVYAGKSGRNLDLRVWYFRGARLASQGEPAKA
jgi:hypothetical protein